MPSDLLLKDKSNDDTIKNSSSDEELKILRELIFKKELDFLYDLYSKSNDPKEKIRYVSDVIAEAFILRTEQDDKLSLALQPTVEEIVKNSVKTNTEELANSLFPLMGPAIRKSITEVFRGMLEGFNKIIEMGFSFKALKWRLEAFKTGRSFSEVILLHTLLYQVEQVFLIHSESGILLGHVSAEGVDYQDGDLVSGMLIAIQDFVKNCFSTGESSLDSMQMADKTLIIEKGTKVSMVLVVRGNLPIELRNDIRDKLDLIHIKMSSYLNNFKGDTSPFKNINYLLDACLYKKFHNIDKKIPFSIKLIPILAFLIVITLISFSWYNNNKFLEAVNIVEKTPGIIVTKVSGGYLSGWEIYVGRDPMAEKTEKLLNLAGFDAGHVKIFETPIISLDESIVNLKVKKLISDIGFQPGVYYNIENGRLTLSGTAPISWLYSFITKARGIPGVTDIIYTEIKDPKVQRLKTLVYDINKTHVYFPIGKYTPEGAEYKKLVNIVNNLAELSTLAVETGFNVNLVVYGHTDLVGSDRINYELSMERAKTLSSMLFNKGVKIPVSIYGFGSKSIVAKDGSQKRKDSRRIDLKVNITHPFISFTDIENI